MFKLAFIAAFFCSFLFVSNVFAAPPTNDDCANAILLVSYMTTCTTPVSGSVLNATNSNSSLTSNTCGTPDDDVWYKFVAQSASTTISLSGMATSNNTLGKSDPAAEVFYSSGGTCSTLNYLTCESINNNANLTVSLSSLTIGATYYIRIFSKTSGAPSADGSFDICITHAAPPSPPSNDECSGATTLSIGTTNSSGTVWYATASSAVPAGCASGTSDDDVWYKFTATANDATIALSSVGTNLSTSGAMIQLFSGSCGSLTSLACAASTLTVGTLTPGTVYYLRIYSAGSGSIGGTSAGSSFSITINTLPSATTGVGRSNEVFQQTTLSAANILYDPWEIAYGPDGYLWITEARGYKVYRMDPNTGTKVTALDISQGASGFLTSTEHANFNVQFSSGQNPWPQGGFAGLVLHPKFLDATSPKNYVYVSYVHRLIGNGSADSTGVIFSNRIVRFTYNTSTNRLESPISLVDTLPGSNDHNSQRMIIAPVGSVHYLFYASGDMGSGQFGNTYRVMRAQDPESYEGKILRFNLEDDGETGTLDKWIPNDNPFNAAKQSAVWVTGIRNNQGFASAAINGVDYLFGSSHGPYSDDELNIIERGKNYGHPLVIGFSNDGNYDGSGAGNKKSSLSITSEAANAAAIGVDYKDPIFSFYAAPKATVSNIYLNNISNSNWPSEAPAGMDVYSNTIIPGWKNSLLTGTLKGGKVIRLKLDAVGNAITSIGSADTVGYFRSVNRFRDVAISPDGKSIFTIIDRSATTSGPTTGSPMVSACAGCVLKYTFLGYQNTSGNRSSIPSYIDVTNASTNTLKTGTTITIDATNNNIWVPITGEDGNILAEIKANGNNLGTVTSSYYISSSVRENASKRIYLNRSITIIPQNQPTSTVNVRLYISNAELSSLVSATNSQGLGSGVSSINDVKVLKNEDANPTVLTAAAATIVPAYADTHSGTNTGGYVLQADVNAFSSFYFGNPAMSVLPLQLITFKGALQNNTTVLQWETSNEHQVAHFAVERSIDGRNFESLGVVKANGGSYKTSYEFTDKDVISQASPIVYYRLKMIDIDNGYKYSNVISVSFKAAAINVFPNPISDELNLRISLLKAENVQIMITDIQGRIIYKQLKKIEAGVNDLKINTKAWPSQSYSLQVIDSKKKILVSKKLVKL